MCLYEAKKASSIATYRQNEMINGMRDVDCDVEIGESAMVNLDLKDKINKYFPTRKEDTERQLRYQYIHLKRKKSR